MPIYKQTTEITNIDDLLSSVERDIEEVYFGNKNVFTVWGEYDGTLPAQYSANGSVLADYRVYGANGGVGDKTENLFDKSAKDTANGYVNLRFLTTNGTLSYSADYYISEYIPVLPNRTYAHRMLIQSGAACSMCFYDDNKTFLSGFSEWYNSTFEAPSTASFCRLSIQKSVENNAMFAEGSTAPASYAPYGHEVDMSVSDGTTSNTVPIYIGDDPLGEDEYISYGEQKIYRMVGGVLTPTDPPVPLPALPTIDGTTITDYAGQSVDPSRFYAKYRKEGF